MKGDKEPSDFVKLAGTVGGLFIVVLIMVAIFSEENLVFVLTNAVWAFVVLGIVLGWFMSECKKKRR